MRSTGRTHWIIAAGILFANGYSALAWRSEGETGPGLPVDELSAADRQVFETLNACAQAFATADIAQSEPFRITHERFGAFEGSYADRGWQS